MFLQRKVGMCMSRIKLSMASLLVGVVINVALVLGASPVWAVITSSTPSNGSTLAGDNQTFAWTGTGITEYWLYVGTSPGGQDILDSGSLGTSLSTTVNGLPTNGNTVYVRLWHLEGGVWLLTDFTYTAFTPSGSGPSALPPWSQTLPGADRFALVMGGEAVWDKETNLVWERSPDTGTMLWASAMSHCAHRRVAGRLGWSLPTVEELGSLADPSRANPALSAGHPFQNVQSFNYWSATTDEVSPATAFILVFGNDGSTKAWPNGQVSNSDKNIVPFHAWCVRGG